MSPWHSLEDVLARASDDETDRLAYFATGERTDLVLDNECPVCGYVAASPRNLSHHRAAKERSTGEPHR